MQRKEKNINFADCYVLTNIRSETFILSFLNEFLPNREPYDFEYQIPQLAAQPERVLQGDAALMQFLEMHPNEPYAVYWYNQEVSILRGAMCLYTQDGRVIPGLFCESRFPDKSIEAALLQQLKSFFDTTQGIILYQEPAPRTTETFLKKLTIFEKEHPQGL